MAQFEFSCTYLAHGHGVQQNVYRSNVFYSTFTNVFFIFATFLRFVAFLKFLFEQFYIYGVHAMRVASWGTGGARVPSTCNGNFVQLTT